MMKRDIPEPTRREFLRILGVAGCSAALCPSGVHAQPSLDPTRAHPIAEATIPQIKMGEESIVILLYPGFTAIDAVAPEYVLSGMMGAKVQFVAKTLAPVRCETGYLVTPKLSFATCPKQPTLLLVPGGTDGLLTALEDDETLDFLQQTGGAAQLASSVCTGSLLLGAAGLLKGYRATSHWQTLELLPLVGAEPVDQRVVFDRDRVTGAGVTAGLDMALQLVKYFRDDFYAKGMQLLAEYDPQPPFAAAGNHRTADARVVTLLNEMHRPFVDKTGEVVRRRLRHARA